jgi:DNA repair protein REV1
MRFTPNSRYKDFSVKFYGVLLRFADNIEVVSVDEALIDATSLVVREAERFASGQEEDPAKRVAETIRAEIRKETSCEGVFICDDQAR